ncbi:hypothetical protein COU61_04180 [Candidatus Pacearchaeota archaeon CG10_big_fil_rev_8_21_14_0_10_35_13]|nr:MAG: hypothetical protein COU61_04180 [Candidatus Pacearchaeota archaeon CG10_big_fil_rev_8_21_14_0_10_35_13]
MIITSEIAEVLGIFVADGCLQDNYICVWGNITEDRDYYNSIVCPLFSKVLNKKILAHEKKSNSVYGFYVCGKDAVNFFRRFGMINNKTYLVNVPKEILDSNDKGVISSFLRGFADCDGGISLLRRKGSYSSFNKEFHTYPRIDLRSVSPKLVTGLSFLLKKLSICHTLWVEKRRRSNESDISRITIRGIGRVEKWMELIGFNNPAQSSRYSVWKKFKFCPVRTNLEQRKRMLNGSLDPYLLYH